MQYFETAHKANSDHDCKAVQHSLFILFVLIQILQVDFLLLHLYTHVAIR